MRKWGKQFAYLSGDINRLTLYIFFVLCQLWKVLVGKNFEKIKIWWIENRIFFFFFFEASSSLPVCRTHPINSRFVDGNDKASLPNQKWRFVHGHDWTSEDEEGWIGQRETPNRGISCAMIGLCTERRHDRRREKKRKSFFWNFSLVGSPPLSSV